jgi:hypothetical protein
MPRDHKVTAAANGSLDVIAAPAKRQWSYDDAAHDDEARRDATSASGAEIRVNGRDGKSADPIRPRGRIRPPARLSLPRPSATRGWR